MNEKTNIEKILSATVDSFLINVPTLDVYAKVTQLNALLDQIEKLEAKDLQNFTNPDGQQLLLINFNLFSNIETVDILLMNIIDTVKNAKLLYSKKYPFEVREVGSLDYKIHKENLIGFLVKDLEEFKISSRIIAKELKEYEDLHFINFKSFTLRCPKKNHEMETYSDLRDIKKALVSGKLNCKKCGNVHISTLTNYLNEIRLFL